MRPLPPAVLLIAPMAALAQSHDGPISHGAASSVAVPLEEPGQGAFAALSEVLARLEADPAADWSRVDLGALRDHLMDLDRLVTDAVVVEEPLSGGLRAMATGEAPTIQSVQDMVTAHAAELARDESWDVAATPTADGATLAVTSPDPATAARIRALGFYGLMASQDHHRAHHRGIATGAMDH